MLKTTLLMIVLSLILTACGAKMEVSTNTTNANPNSPVTTANSNTGNASAGSNSNVNKPVNTNANVKPADNSPKRIAFSKGANWGAMNITLAPGAAQKFVVGAKKGQMMDVEVSSKETSVNLIKGKAQTTEDFGYLNAELQANGDYIFEVKNSTKKEIKTSVKVTIESNSGDADNADGAEDNDDVEN
jgi:hypothetical protein